MKLLEIILPHLVKRCEQWSSQVETNVDSEASQHQFYGSSRMAKQFADLSNMRGSSGVGYPQGHYPGPQCSPMPVRPIPGHPHALDPGRPPSVDHQKFSSPTGSSFRTEVPQIRTEPGLGPGNCAGCAGPIIDRFYLVTADRYWHLDCLHCSMCNIGLAEEVSCFIRNDFVYCKTDYFRQFSTCCSRCAIPIAPKEFILKAKQFTYHTGCFTCVVCCAQLNPGQYFAVDQEGHLYCQMHYEPLLYSTTTSVTINVDQPGSEQYTGIAEVSYFYHIGCFTCVVCCAQLNPGQYFAVDQEGHLYCQMHYEPLLYSTTTSVTINVDQPGSEQYTGIAEVSYYYHIGCFMCVVCCAQLNPGQYFAVDQEGHLYCQMHYEPLLYSTTTSVTINVDQPGSEQYTGIAENPGQYFAVDQEGHLYCQMHYEPLLYSTTTSVTINVDQPGSEQYTGIAENPDQYFAVVEEGHLYCQMHYEPLLYSTTTSVTINVDQPGSEQYTGISEQDTTGMVNVTSAPKRSKKKRASQRSGEMYSHPNDMSSGDLRHMGPGCHRAKRMRTSFKHHQLKAMKAYFALNHNPDAKDLKQLAQRTGLSKRVLQVWFQNARAKFRRSKGSDGTDLGDDQRQSISSSLQTPDPSDGPMDKLQSPGSESTSCDPNQITPNTMDDYDPCRVGDGDKSIDGQDEHDLHTYSVRSGSTLSDDEEPEHKSIAGYFHQL